MKLRLLTKADGAVLAALFQRNQPRFQPFEPTRPAYYYTADYHAEVLAHNGKDTTYFTFGLFADGELVGHVKLSGILRGGAQSAWLGYALDGSATGRGWMTQAVRAVTDFAFAQCQLHRIQASVLPENRSSVGVLTRCGFTPFGLSRQHLCIQGSWRDHALYELTAVDTAAVERQGEWKQWICL